MKSSWINKKKHQMRKWMKTEDEWMKWMNKLK